MLGWRMPPMPKLATTKYFSWLLKKERAWESEHTFRFFLFSLFVSFFRWESYLVSVTFNNLSIVLFRGSMFVAFDVITPMGFKAIPTCLRHVLSSGCFSAFNATCPLRVSTSPSLPQASQSCKSINLLLEMGLLWVRRWAISSHWLLCLYPWMTSPQDVCMIILIRMLDLAWWTRPMGLLKLVLFDDVIPTQQLPHKLLLLGMSQWKAQTTSVILKKD